MSKKQPRPSPADQALALVYPFIVRFVMKNGRTPTVRQIRDGCRLSSTSVASSYIDILIERKLIEKENDKARSLRVVGLSPALEPGAPHELVQALAKGGRR